MYDYKNEEEDIKENHRYEIGSSPKEIDLNNSSENDQKEKIIEYEIPDHIWNNFLKVIETDDKYNIIKSLDDINDRWTKEFPTTQFLQQNKVFQTLIHLSSRLLENNIQKHALQLLETILSQSDYNIETFVEIDGLTEFLISLISSHNENIICKSINLLILLIKNENGRKKLSYLNFLDTIINLCNTALDKIDDAQENEKKETLNLISHFLPFFEAIFENITEFSREIFFEIVHIYVNSYNNPFRSLIQSTSFLIKQIFSHFQEMDGEDPWTLLKDTELLDICCTIVPTLDKSLQAPMLDVLLQLTETTQEDAQFLILERVD